MKQIIIFILTLALCAFGLYWDALDKECRKFMGWELYSVYPEPMCHVDKNIAPLRDLRHNDIDIDAFSL
ncbi:MAG: hypothetical protein AB1649_03430 [Chloroflexota bacterium]